jgi:UDP-2-acetamido-3-amino-2,3-dideoxy-glucuronate N-acetyltransferase
MSRFDNCRFIQEGVVISHSVIIEPGVIVLNSQDGPRTSIGANVKIGANATILGGVRLGDDCIVRPGSVVESDVPPRVIVAGNPAVIVGYAQKTSPKIIETSRLSESVRLDEGETKILLLQNGTHLLRIPSISDLRGDLCVGEFPREVPFTPVRFFFVYNVPTVELRGEHAHKECHQFLICVSGSCSVVVDDGSYRREVMLNNLTTGVYMPPLTWGTQYKYSADAVLLVLASHLYDPGDYIRSYHEFCRVVSPNEGLGK